MKQNFTLNQLTRLLYKETTPEETAMLLELTDLCAPLKVQFEEMKTGMRQLDEISLTPSSDSILNVLKYSALQTAWWLRPKAEYKQEIRCISGLLFFGYSNYNKRLWYMAQRVVRWNFIIRIYLIFNYLYIALLNIYKNKQLPGYISFKNSTYE